MLRAPKLLVAFAVVVGSLALSAGRAEGAKLNLHVTFGSARQPQCSCRGRGHYVRRCRTVCVSPGRWVIRYVSAIIVTRYDDRGNPYTVVVRPGYWTHDWIAARYETRYVRVRVPCPTPQRSHRADRSHTSGRSRSVDRSHGSGRRR